MNIDQIAEFKLLTNSQPAEYGRSSCVRYSGASISVVTKSGSRDLHCTGYLFHRYAGINANYWRNKVECNSANSSATTPPSATSVAPSTSRRSTRIAIDFF